MKTTNEPTSPFCTDSSSLVVVVRVATWTTSRVELMLCVADLPLPRSWRLVRFSLGVCRTCGWTGVSGFRRRHAVRSFVLSQFRGVSMSQYESVGTVCVSICVSVYGGI